MIGVGRLRVRFLGCSGAWVVAAYRSRRDEPIAAGTGASCELAIEDLRTRLALLACDLLSAVGELDACRTTRAVAT